MEKLLRNQINALAIGLLVLTLMVIIQFGILIKIIANLLWGGDEWFLSRRNYG